MGITPRFLPLLGRILLALIFVVAGLRKVASVGATAAYMASHGIPLSGLLVYGAIVVELGAGLMLTVGWHARQAALALCLYTVVLALIFHAFWAAPVAARSMQFAFFFGHLSMMGGMLYVAAFGAGPLSLDWRRERA